MDSRRDDPTHTALATLSEQPIQVSDHLQTTPRHVIRYKRFTSLCSAIARYMYTVSQKRPAFTTCYNFYTHSSIATIFGVNVADKVGNQNVLYFPTTPN